MEYGARMRWVKGMKEFRKLGEGSTEEELRRGFEGLVVIRSLEKSF